MASRSLSNFVRFLFDELSKFTGFIIFRDIPVDFKYIADPSMHSMPAVTLAPNGKWLGCQSLDNKIVIFDVQTRFRLKRKKVFKGHMVGGLGVDRFFLDQLHRATVSAITFAVKN